MKTLILAAFLAIGMAGSIGCSGGSSSSKAESACSCGAPGGACKCTHCKGGTTACNCGVKK